MANHYTYIVQCSDHSLYTGYTNNLEARMTKHNAGKGAKYTKARLPVQLMYHEVFPTKSEALKREAAIKRLTRAQKLQLIKR
ncbi:GIY-YIG nuclease family protein [Staphylococcus sp. 11261D007BR]